MSDTIKFPLVLLIITVVCGAVLTGLYQVTKGPIAAMEKMKKEKSIREIFGPDAEITEKSAEITAADGKKETVAYFEVKMKDDPEGRYYAVIGKSAKCYNSAAPIQIMVGVRVLEDGKFKVKKIAVVKSAETPGLGENIKNTEKKSLFDILFGRAKDEPGKDNRVFLRQFNDRDPAQLKLKQDGGVIDGITGATITSRAVTYAVEDALQKLKKILGAE